ncbi:MAG TPA: hypothetical protein DIS90_12610 [Cytophagales bacterium]|nr:hypothetical protein [Cytophagales bacterium]
MGSRSAALAYASSTLSDDWAIFNNIAGMAKINTASSNFAYSINPSLPGADRAAASLLAPVKIGTFGIGVFRFGDELYSEQVLSAGYANQFGLAALGMKVNYVQYRAEGVGTHSAVSLHLGGIATLSPKVMVGAYIINLNRPEISNAIKERLPAKLITGVQFHPEEKLILLAEIEKDLHYKPTLKGGVEYQFFKKVSFRTGFNLGPNSVHGGIGYQSARLYIDYAMHYSTSLLSTFQLATSYRFGQPKKQE